MSARDDALARDLAARARLASDPVAQILLKRRYDHPGQGPRRPEITDHELEVLRYASRGLSTPMIADAMRIKPSMVKDYLQEARSKLGAKTSTHAVANAIRRGLIP